MKKRVIIRPTGPTKRGRSTAGYRDLAPTEPTMNVSRPFVIEGEFEIEIEEVDLNAYVQVEFLGSSYRYYTYIDPSGALRVGDLVEVNTPLGPSVAKVVELGRGSYGGPCKAVTAKLTKEEL